MNKLDAKSLPDLVRIADVIGVLRLEAAERESEDRKLGS
jgi:hypothetical protein